MKKKKVNINKKVVISTEQEISLDDLAHYISTTIEPEDVPIFIALLDKSYEDWDVTETLVNHYSAMKEIMIKELDGEDYDLIPKLIEV